MIFLQNKTNRALFAAIIILLILACFMPPKAVKAQLGTAQLPMQIMQWIQAMIDMIKQYIVQNITKYYTQITSQIEQWTKTDILDQRSLKDSWNETRFELLDELSSDIIDWAQKGADGKPTFIIDWEEHISEKTEAAADTFITDTLENTQMCDTYATEVKADVKSINDSLKLDSGNFQDSVKCSANEASDSFLTSENFTWTRWITALQSNYTLDLLQSLDELSREKQSTYDAEMAKAQANQGFKGNEDTPGIIQSYASQRASMMDFDYLLQSDETNEYLSSVVDAFINRIKSEGLKNMATKNSTTPYASQCPAEKNGVKYQKVNGICKPIVEIPEDKEHLDYALGIENHADQLLTVLKKIQEEFSNEIIAINNNIDLLDQIIEQLNKCGASTDKAEKEKADLQTAKSNITRDDDIGKSHQAKDAITSLGALIVELEKVKNANKKGVDATTKAAVDAFMTIHDTETLPAIGTLFDYSPEDLAAIATNKDLEILHTESMEYLAKVQTDVSDYKERLGGASYSNLDILNWKQTQFLYGWLACVRHYQTLTACAGVDTCQ